MSYWNTVGEFSSSYSLSSAHIAGPIGIEEELQMPPHTLPPFSTPLQISSAIENFQILQIFV
jgi:hypothetical protein